MWRLVPRLPSHVLSEARGTVEGVNEMLCKDCDKVALFVQPDCDDGCDEFDLMCVLCGAAITFGGMLTLSDARESSAA